MNRPQVFQYPSVWDFDMENAMISDSFRRSMTKMDLRELNMPQRRIALLLFSKSLDTFEEAAFLEGNEWNKISIMFVTVTGSIIRTKTGFELKGYVEMDRDSLDRVTEIQFEGEEVFTSLPIASIKYIETYI